MRNEPNGDFKDHSQAQESQGPPALQTMTEGCVAALVLTAVSVEAIGSL